MGKHQVFFGILAWASITYWPDASVESLPSFYRFSLLRVALSFYRFCSSFVIRIYDPQNPKSKYFAAVLCTRFAPGYAHLKFLTFALYDTGTDQKHEGSRDRPKEVSLTSLIVNIRSMKKNNCRWAPASGTTTGGLRKFSRTSSSTNTG